MNYFSEKPLLFSDNAYYDGNAQSGTVEAGVVGGTNFYLVRPDAGTEISDAALYASWFRSHVGGANGDGVVNRVILDVTDRLFDVSFEYGSLPPAGKVVADTETQATIDRALNKVTLDPNIGAREGFDRETGLAIGLTAIRLIDMLRD